MTQTFAEFATGHAPQTSLLEQNLGPQVRTTLLLLPLQVVVVLVLVALAVLVVLTVLVMMVVLS